MSLGGRYRRQPLASPKAAGAAFRTFIEVNPLGRRLPARAAVFLWLFRNCEGDRFGTTMAHDGPDWGMR